MDVPPRSSDPGAPASPPHPLIRAVLRAAGSTIVIALIATLIAAGRDGDWRLQKLAPIFFQHGLLWLFVFLGLVVWEFLFGRSRDQSPRDDPR